jgi:hypothetical protein
MLPEYRLFYTGIRELAISPLLVSTLPWPQYARRRHELGIKDASSVQLEPLSWSELRQHKTLDSGLSGALAGSLLRGWKCTLNSMLFRVFQFLTPCTSWSPCHPSGSTLNRCRLHPSPNGVQRSWRDPSSVPLG